MTVFVLLLASGAAQAQFAWPKGKQAAIVLTYDDALRSQLDIAVPQLAAARLRGTFFLDGDIEPADMIAWRKVQKAGFELGNHSLNHPCPRAMLPQRTQYLTDNYDVTRMLDEIQSMNNVLFGIDGHTARNYSVPCSQMIVGGTDYKDALRKSGLVQAVRTGGDQYKSVIADCKAFDRFEVASYGPVDRPDGAQLILYVERVRAAGGLGVLQFHGVGGDYLEITAQAHRELLEHLRRHPEIWVGTFQQVVDYAAAHCR